MPAGGARTCYFNKKQLKAKIYKKGKSKNEKRVYFIDLSQ